MGSGGALWEGFSRFPSPHSPVGSGGFLLKSIVPTVSLIEQQHEVRLMIVTNDIALSFLTYIATTWGQSHDCHELYTIVTIYISLSRTIYHCPELYIIVTSQLYSNNMGSKSWSSRTMYHCHELHIIVTSRSGDDRLRNKPVRARNWVWARADFCWSRLSPLSHL